MEDLIKRFEKMEAHVVNTVRGRNPGIGGRNLGMGERNIQCRSCGRMGHYANNCRMPKSNNRGEKRVNFAEQEYGEDNYYYDDRDTYLAEPEYCWD